MYAPRAHSSCGSQNALHFSHGLGGSEEMEDGVGGIRVGDIRVGDIHMTAPVYKHAWILAWWLNVQMWAPEQGYIESDGGFLWTPGSAWVPTE